MSDIVGNPEDRFSRVAAQMCLLCQFPSGKWTIHMYFESVCKWIMIQLTILRCNLRTKDIFYQRAESQAVSYPYMCISDLQKPRSRTCDNF